MALISPRKLPERRPAAGDAAGAYRPSTTGTSPPVLCIGYTVSTLAERCDLLRNAGYDALPAFDREQALQILNERPFAAIIIGHAVPEQDRQQFIAAARGLNHDAIVVLLYWDSIRSAEAADAILCIGNGPTSLVQAMRDLMGS